MNSTLKKVCIIGPFPENVEVIRGGTQAAVYGLAHTLKTHYGLAVKVIALPLAASSSSSVRTAEVEGMEVVYLNARGFLAAGLLHLPLILRRISVGQVVHVHGTGLLQAALLAVLRMKRIKCVWTLHGILAKETWQKYLAGRNGVNFARYMFYRVLERVMITVASRIIVDTQYVAGEIGGGGKVAVIPQGTMFSEEFACLPDPACNPPVILSVGVIRPRKGHHITLNAFVVVKRAIPEARLVIAGAAPEAGYYQALQEQAARLGISADVEFLIDLPRHRIAEIFAGARVFALHSQEESQGIALCEALAAGLPVVATRVGGIPYVVSDGKDGLLMEYNDAVGFAGAIVSLLADGGMYRKMSQAARNSGAKFSWKNITDEIIRVYSKL